MASCIGRNLGSCVKTVGYVGMSLAKLDKGLSFVRDVNSVVSNSLMLASMHTRAASGVQVGLNAGLTVCSEFSGAMKISQTFIRWGRVLSGQMIFKINKDGTFARDSKTGKLLTSPVLSIASDIFDLTSKSLGSMSYGHKKRLCNLGSHAEGIGMASTITGVASSSCSLIQSCINLRNIVHNPSSQNERRTVIRNTSLLALRDVLDIAAAPLESGLINAGVAGLTAGCSLSLIGSVLGIVNIILND